jgi:hypothetical protein
MQTRAGRSETHLQPRGEHAGQKKQRERKNRRPVEHHRKDYLVGQKRPEGSESTLSSI